MKLTGIVAYIPQPVVAGYLGYVGYFCLVAGVAQGTSLPIHSPWSWTMLLTHAEAYTKALATLSCYCAILFSIKVIKMQVGLPLMLVVIPALWYALLAGICMVEGMGWGDLQEWLGDNGWVTKVEGDAHQPFWEVRLRLHRCSSFSC
jgi:MFS superfamily sulfate permease-like transporter